MKALPHKAFSVTSWLAPLSIKWETSLDGVEGSYDEDLDQHIKWTTTLLAAGSSTCKKKK